MLFKYHFFFKSTFDFVSKLKVHASSVGTDERRSHDFLGLVISYWLLGIISVQRIFFYVYFIEIQLSFFI